MRSLHRPLLALVALASSGCDVTLPLPPGLADGLAGSEPRIALEPPSSLDAVPRAVRVHLALPGVVIDPGRVFLIRGEVGPAHLRQLQRGEPSKALSERMVPAITWANGEEGGVVLAPIAPLDAGEMYSVASGEPMFDVALQVAADDEAPVLGRVWPPEEMEASDFAVWCGAAPLPALDLPASLEPGGSPGRFRRGVAATSGRHCVRFEIAEGEGTPALDPVSLPPPVLGEGSDRWLLEPRPFSAVPGEAAPVVPLSCEEGEFAFGPGCVKIADDRLYGRSPAAPVLWAVVWADQDRVFTTAPGDPFVLAPLAPSTAVSFDISALDVRGASSRSMLSVVTAGPMPHLVLNEVLANPSGSEPAQEWIEIVNDGSAPAELGDYTLIDVGGSTSLPPGVLAPGGFALLVNESYLEKDDFDLPPAPGTTILRVPKLGEGGLANGGEPLALIDGEGVKISSFPAIPAKKAGKSVARRSILAPDGLLNSFVLTDPTPGHPNVW